MMKHTRFRRRWLWRALLPAMIAAIAGLALAQPSSADTDSSDDSGQRVEIDHHGLHHHREQRTDNNEVVTIGSDAHLPAGAHGDSVVAILGSAISEGDADTVVSVLGETRVTGPLTDSAVAILGNVYVDSKIDGDAVAVLGNIELGPDAEVGGDVVAIGGALHRDASAVVHGETQTVLSGAVGGFAWLKPWLRHCLLLGRPLALVPGIGWAWTMALGFLALYVLLALLFRPSVTHCVQTFETHPGQCIVAALLATLLSPIVVTLLCITVIGIAAVPFFVAAILFAGLFGKAVLLAWIGSRVLARPQSGALSHPAVAVLIGGAIVLILYVVPVLGIIVYKILGLLGLGIIVYTLLVAARARRAAAAPGAGIASTPASGPGAEITGAPETAGPRDAAAAAAAASATEAPPATTMTSAPTPAVTAANAAALPRAGFWIRMAALLLDGLLVGIVIGALHHKFDVELLVLATYGALMWKVRGATVGGIVFDLQVVRVDGQPIDWATAAVRAMSCFLSLAPAGLGFLWIAFDSEKQAWHDKIAGTVVVRTTKRISLT
jgi:uncharacterized RDD family membrane protein YckC